MKQLCLKIGILILFVVILTVGTKAQVGLYIHSTDGRQYSHALSTIRKLTFPEENMEITFNKVPAKRYSIAEIQYCNFRNFPDWPQNNEQWITLKVYPNPTDNKLIIECSEDMNEISLYDITGRRVMIVFPKKTSTILRLGNFSRGIYILQLFTTRGMRIKEIIKI